MLLADLKRAGCSEAQIKSPGEQCSRLLSQAGSSETEASGYLARPEFTQLCRSTRPATRTAFPTDPIWSARSSFDTPRRCLTILFSAAGRRHGCDHPRSRQAGHDCRCARPTFCADPSVLLRRRRKRRGGAANRARRQREAIPTLSAMTTVTAGPQSVYEQAVASRLLDSKNSLHCSQPCWFSSAPLVGTCNVARTTSSSSARSVGSKLATTSCSGFFVLALSPSSHLIAARTRMPASTQGLR